MRKIVSGGQTGADRAALDFAISHRIPHGGWCPAGRLAEDGRLDWRYRLKQTPSSAYAQRTEWNVRDSDGTLILSLRKDLRGGSRLTEIFAQRHRKPCLHICKSNAGQATGLLNDFLVQNQIGVLNVAGPRASTEPKIAVFVTAILEEWWKFRSVELSKRNPL